MPFSSFLWLCLATSLSWSFEAAYVSSVATLKAGWPVAKLLPGASASIFSHCCSLTTILGVRLWTCACTARRCYSPSLTVSFTASKQLLSRAAAAASNTTTKMSVSFRRTWAAAKLHALEHLPSNGTEAAALARCFFHNVFALLIDTFRDVWVWASKLRKVELASAIFLFLVPDCIAVAAVSAFLTCSVRLFLLGSEAMPLIILCVVAWAVASDVADLARCYLALILSGHDSPTQGHTKVQP